MLNCRLSPNFSPNSMLLADKANRPTEPQRQHAPPCHAEHTVHCQSMLQPPHVSASMCLAQMHLDGLTYTVNTETCLPLFEGNPVCSMPVGNQLSNHKAGHGCSQTTAGSGLVLLHCCTCTCDSIIMFRMSMAGCLCFAVRTSRPILWPTSCHTPVLEP
jgi:hypothetical protein